MKESLDGFATIIYKMLRSDRDNNIVVGGFTGEGKTTLDIQLIKAYCRVAGVPFSFENNITWQREELLAWIDGKADTVAGKDGLRPEQKPEYTPILVDELFLLFYKRTWFDSAQIDAVATLNMCRDRHLLILGNVPNFWDMDGAFLSRVRFYVYVVKRGVAWVFEQEANPFTADPWNRNANKMLFRRLKSPYRMPNFVCELEFTDLSPDEKAEYLRIRNIKRVMAVQNKDPKRERYTRIKGQRDELIRLLFDVNERLGKEFKGVGLRKLSNKGVAALLGISEEAVRKARIG